MDFITDNYIWIIVAVVIILMTLIGYIAEKTDFGKKEFAKREKKEKQKKSKENKKKAVKEEQPIVEESAETKTMPVEITDATKQEEVTPLENTEVQFGEPLADDMEVSAETSMEAPEITPMEEDLNVPFGESVEVSEPEATVTEDLNAPFGDEVAENAEAESLDSLNHPSSENMELPVEEDLNAPFGDDFTEPSNDDVSLDLPDIDTVKEDVTTNDESKSDDDDIWKF